MLLLKALAWIRGLGSTNIGTCSPLLPSARPCRCIRRRRRHSRRHLPRFLQHRWHIPLSRLLQRPPQTYFWQEAGGHPQHQLRQAPRERRKNVRGLFRFRFGAGALLIWARCWSSDTYNPCPGVMDGVDAAGYGFGGFLGLCWYIAVAVGAAAVVSATVLTQEAVTAAADRRGGNTAAMAAAVC